MRLVVAATVILVLCVSLNSSALAETRIVPQGKSAVVLHSVYKSDGEIYFSAPELFDALGLVYSWQARTGKLILKTDDQSIILSPGTAHVLVGDRTWRLSTPPTFINGTLCVPLEFLERTLPILGNVKVSLEKLDPQTPPPLPLYKRSRVLKRLVIDPGHGGHDTGARSPSGINEKDINLAVALKLKNRLEAELGLEVIVTRDEDYFIPLSARTQIGNRSDADLFLSIHANGSYSHTATGLETYFLSFEATDRQAAKLAEEENTAIQYDPQSPLSAFESQDDIKMILQDMVNAENMKASEKLAEAVQTRLVQALNLPNRGVKQAPFFVLVGSKAPAILVEVGFVSNPEESQRLIQPQVQDGIADALFKAILYYDQVLSKK